MNRPAHEPSDNATANRVPLFLSAFVCPGAGQFCQQRWIAGLFFSGSFIACFVIVTVRVIKAIVANFGAASAMAGNSPDQDFASLTVLDILLPFAAGVGIYVIGLVDTWLAYRRRRRIMAENRLRQKTGLLPFACLALLAYFPLAATSLASGLHRAVLSNDISEVNAILDRNTVEIVNSTVGDGITPLHLAAAMDNEEMTALLIARGADLAAQTTGGFTPLHWASGKDAVRSARLLIAGGADINARAGGNITPLHWAATKNSTKVTELLISAGADINARTSANLTPLHWAVKTEANDAAAVIAYTAVSREEESSASAATETETTGKEKPDSDALPPDVSQPTGLTRSAFGKSPVVPIGPDTELAFVWIDALQIWMGKYEVTNGQYRQFKTDHKSLFYEGFTLGRASQPVVYVSWQDASDFCAWLNRTFNDRIPANCAFRLPTEKEWVTVARCGDDRIYPWGNNMPPVYGNYSDRAAKRDLSEWSGIANYDDGYPVTCPVSDSGENEWGIFGLGGNVWEWCGDWYDSEKKYKIRHGGSWYFDPEECLRIDWRGFDRPDARYDTIGFRLVLSRVGP